MLLEVYARIKDFEQYAISNYGEVINIKTGNKLKPSLRNGYPCISLPVNKKFKHKYIHRLVANAFLDKIENKTLIDHIDNNKTNNCLDNLRFCNHSENMRNTKISKINKCSVKGVSYKKDTKKWRAYITFNKQKTHIGCFDSLEEAKIARQNKSLELFGEFLNECEK